MVKMSMSLPRAQLHPMMLGSQPPRLRCIQSGCIYGRFHG